MTIDSEFGQIYLLLVGELSIQDFDFKKSMGSIKRGEEIGNFNWGSQVVMIYERGRFPESILIKETHTYFVGDGVH